MGIIGQDKITKTMILQPYAFMDVECSYCGKQYKANKYNIKKSEKNYCSKKCQGEDKSNKILLKCKICNKEFAITPGKLKQTGGKYCSKKCFAKAREKRTDKNCAICGKVFRVAINKANKRATCGDDKCSREYKSRCISGDKHYMWKGGCQDARINIRESRQMKLWRQEVFKRDNFTCQKCGFTGGYLHAHHIKQFKVLLDEMRYNLPLLSLEEAAKIYTPMWDVSNGITYCPKCHKDLHGLSKKEIK